MLIGEVAARSGVSAKTLRYDEAVLGRLAFIRAAQALGLTLGEIRGIVALRDDGQPPCGHVLDLLRGRVEEVERTIRELRALRRDLTGLVERAADLDPKDCEPDRVCHLIGPER